MTSRISSEVCLSIYAVSTYHHALSEIAFHVPANIPSCSMRVLQIEISNSYFIQLFRPIEQLHKNTTVSVFFTPALVSSNKYIKFILEIPIYKTFNIRSISTYHTIPHHNMRLFNQNQHVFPRFRTCIQFLLLKSIYLPTQVQRTLVHSEPGGE
jgi:hypothetical protein